MIYYVFFRIGVKLNLHSKLQGSSRQHIHRHISKINVPLKSRLLNEFSCRLVSLPDYAEATEMWQQTLPIAT
uniref:AAE15 n=1 Tax=Arundo donax TaxID=35708 RepID=A0A0A9HIS6_ARUDO